MKQKRDNAYYLERLRLEHPQVYGDYRAGKFKNITDRTCAARPALTAATM